MEIKRPVNRKQFFVFIPDLSMLSVTKQNRPQSTAEKLFFRTESISSDRWNNSQKILSLTKWQYQSGFTLIEVLLTMALVAIIALLSSPFYSRFIFSQEVSVTRDELQGSFAKAQLYSMSGKNNSRWGVAVNNGKIILFQGASFTSRYQSFDETFSIHKSVTVSGMDEIVFAQATGKPNNQPTITITGNNETKILTMNGEGVLDEQ